MTDVRYRSRFAVAAAALAIIGIGACKETITEPITVASVTVQGGTSSIRPGQSTQLTATLKSTEGWTLPSTGITWTSSNGTVATVSSSGQVSGLKRGTATITASAGTASGAAAVTIIGVQTLKATPETLAVAVGQSRPLTVTTTQDPGVLVTLQWRSLDTTIARVDADGRITGRVAGGVTRVEVTADDLKDTSVVRVLAPIAAIEVKPSSAVYASSDTGTIAFRPVDANGALINYTVFGASLANLGGPTDCITLVTGGACTQRVNVGSLPAGSFPVRDSGYVWADYDAVAKGWFRVWRVSTVMDSLRLSMPNGSTSNGASVLVGDTVQLNSTLYFPGGSGSAVNTLYDVVSGAATLVRCATGWGTVAVQAACVRVVATTAGEVGVRARFRRSDGQFVVDTLRLMASTQRAVTYQTIAVGARHACGLTADGSAYCWGDNTGFGIYGGGALGDGTTISRTSPVAVSGGIKFVSLHIGVARSYTCGLSVDGDAYCWGSNSEGQLGDGTQQTRLTPVRAAPSHKFTMLSTDHLGVCGLKVDDTIWCWGNNILGQLGDGTKTRQLTPVQFKGVSGVRRIMSGIYLTCAELWSGETKCLGQEFEYANQTRVILNTPTALQNGVVIDVAIGVYHLCGRISGEFVCWGQNAQGELGDGLRTNGRANPEPPATTVKFVTSTNAGHKFHCELSAAGVPYCWGRGEADEFASLPASPAPAAIGGAPALVSLATGGFACGLDVSGTAYCWGRNEAGQLGDGTTTTRASAAPVSGGIKFKLP